MKKLYIFSILCVISVYACSEGHDRTDKFSINGILKNAPDTTYLTIEYVRHVDDVWKTIRIDSIPAYHGHFSCTGEVNALTSAYLWFDGNRFPIVIYLEPTDIRLQIDVAAPYLFKESGTTVDWEIGILQKHMSIIEKECDENIMKYNSVVNKIDVKEIGHGRKSPDYTIDSLYGRRLELFALKARALKDFSVRYADYQICPDLLRQVVETDTTMLKWIKDFAEKELTDKIRESYLGQYLFERIRFFEENIHHVKQAVGAKAPDFCKRCMSGNLISLQNYFGRKYVLLHFWSSWNLPESTDLLKRLYSKYGNQYLEIIGVSYDYKKESWKESVIRENMTWPQIYDRIFNEKTLCDDFEILNRYPNIDDAAYILIDKNGNIIKAWRNLREQDILYIETLLKDKIEYK